MWPPCVPTVVPFTVRLVMLSMRRRCPMSTSKLSKQRKSEPMMGFRYVHDDETP